MCLVNEKKKNISVIKGKHIPKQKKTITIPLNLVKHN